ncbi:hypothetical protein CANCADRAFT_44156 [Tortispora caseinolytica NRRL Y-17796]|uniref:Uncharacterized protein n=1 Tax=Tortispora caseinolytica NRRL Y-17796 TaxID=767744 RepID=A0A1E4TFH7_9ASCO|nr:hypothetical protein CANCADRAFT_44156 [Tortispora caseinolytica NRRL Y-17796]
MNRSKDDLNGASGAETPLEREASVNDDSLSAQSSEIPRRIPTQHDKLWAELDMLTELDAQAEQVIAEGSFFGKKHSDAIDVLEKAQLNFREVLSRTEEQLQEQLRTSRSNMNSLREAVDPSATKPATEPHSKDTPEVENLDQIRSVLFDKETTRAVESAVDQVIASLKETSQGMQSYEEQAKDIWNDPTS